MNQDYVTKLQKWVVLDNKAIAIREKIKEIQEENKELLAQKDDIEKDIIEYVTTNKLDAITIRTSDGNIKFAKKSATQSLSLKILKTLMTEFCKSHPDITSKCEEMYQYINDNLEKKSKITLVRKID